MVTIGTLSGCPWRCCWTSPHGYSFSAPRHDFAASREPRCGLPQRVRYYSPLRTRPAGGGQGLPATRGNGRRAGPSVRRLATLRKTSSTFFLPRGFFQRTHRSRRPRHGRGPRDRQYARLRAWPRHRALGAVGRRDRRPLRRGARRRPRGEADAGPHAGHDPGNSAPQGRRDRRLRRHRADAPPLHPEGAPEPLGAPARRRVRAVRRDRRREARRRGGVPVRGRAPGLPDRGADGGRDRSRAAGRRADRATSSSTSAEAPARSP